MFIQRSERISKFFDENYEPIQIGKLYSFEKTNCTYLFDIKYNPSIVFWEINSQKGKRINVNSIFVITKKEKHYSGTVKIHLLFDSMIWYRILYTPEYSSEISPYFKLVS